MAFEVHGFRDVTLAVHVGHGLEVGRGHVELVFAVEEARGAGRSVSEMWLC